MKGRLAVAFSLLAAQIVSPALYQPPLQLRASECSSLDAACRQQQQHGPSLVLLRLRGGKIAFADGNEANILNVETASVLENIRNSLDPAEFPPMEIQYNDDGDMVVPPPMSLEPIAEFRRLVDESGRLLTSKEAENLGLSNFTKKKKGKNSLAQRCTCGNKLPCDGDVMITKNEHGKLEYNKIPRHWVGPAHNFETRQPAQYMVTPSKANLTQLLGHLRYARQKSPVNAVKEPYHTHKGTC